jgi:hypothetical protein
VITSVIVLDLGITQIQQSVGVVVLHVHARAYH